MAEFLLTIFLITAFVLLLCLLTSLANKLLGQSGQAVLTVNGKKITAERGQTLLSALAEANIYLPAACGAKGTCGKCAIRVIEGGGAINLNERLVLTQEELNNSYRLACQVKIRSDIRVEADQSALNAKSFEAKLDLAHYAADGIKILEFQIKNGEELNFKPGQYVQVVLNMPNQRVLRAYSISSAATPANKFTLDVQRVSSGLVSGFLHELKANEVLNFCGPFGEMCLTNELYNSKLLLAAGGVGLAPMRSIIGALASRGFKHRVWLFHGANNRNGLYYEKYFIELSKQFKNFIYAQAVSNPLLEEGYTGARGMIHEVIEKESFSELPDMAFVCGNEAMMRAVKKVLLAKGLTSDRILSDSFEF